MHYQDPGLLRLRCSPQSVLALLQFLVCACCYLWQPDCALSLSSDGLTLLSIKSAISSDALELLSDWKDDGRDPCLWNGVGCDDSSRVVSLNITINSSCGRDNDVKSCFGVCPCDSSNDSSCQASEKSSAQSRSTAVDSKAASIHKSTACCTLVGILSPAIGNLSQLKILSLPFHSFFGALPEQISVLTSLEVLDLRCNEFTGSIPAAFGHLSRLTTLNLAYNSLEGTVPPEISGCQKLEVFNVAGNRLSGNIPVFLAIFSDLRVLDLSFNNLIGTIPAKLTGSCENLEYFHADYNFLSGSIPKGFGNCSHLQSLTLSSNLLSGPIPSDVGLLQRLRSLDVSGNSLSGEIPAQVGNCSQLSLLVLTNYLDRHACCQCSVHEEKRANGVHEKAEHNHFRTFPLGVLNLPALQILWAPRAVSIGVLPSNWSSCQSLEVLNLAGNSITGTVPAGLANCRRLIYLDLSSNKLEGIIPQKLPIPCMVVFNVSENALSGVLPDLSDVTCPSTGLFSALPLSSPAAMCTDNANVATDSIYQYFSSLYCGTVVSSLPVCCMTQGMPIVHDFRTNNISGTLPDLLVGPSLLNRVSSYALLASGNKLTGTVASRLFESCQNFQALFIDLSKGQLSGTLPAEAVVKCSSLRQFASGHLTGRTPSGLGSVHQSVYLDLGTRKLRGELPSHVGQLQKLYRLLVNSNLTGTIPEDLRKLSSPVPLDLQDDKSKGGIPGCLENLEQLKELLLNDRCFLGIIRMNLTHLNHMVVMDVAFKNLAGSTPQFGNSSLHSTMRFTNNESGNSFSASVPNSSLHQWDMALPYQEPLLVKRRGHLQSSIVAAAITSGCAIAGVLIILIILFWYTRRRVPVQPVYRSGKKELVTFRSIGVQLTYDNVVAATGNFSLSNLIGNGGFGATYKAEVMPGLLVAVKRLSLGRFQGTRHFAAEIGTLGRIHHPNLVTLVGYHASESQMFLIYNYLPGGNLENLIHNGSRGKINWRVRHKIALDVARALAYLHDECTPKVLHRDIKPSNVLLDNNLNAFLSDFGLARLLGASETHATTDVEGTFGYVAPEYAMTCRLSHKADVYSYGVVLLELLSGKRALDPSFSDCGNGVDIVHWACKLCEIGRPTDIFAPGLWEKGPRSELSTVLKLAVKCTVESLSARPTMKQVVDILIAV